MPSKLIINGREYVSGYVQPYESYSVQASEALEAVPRYPSKPPQDFWDGPCNLRYRVIDNVGDERFTLADLMKVSGQNKDWVTDQVVDGTLDAAVRRGTEVPLFRVKKPAVLVKDSKPQVVSKPAKNNGWHKKL